MSQGINYLHSHSLIERDLKFPKHTVLIDGTYKYLFDGTQLCASMYHKGIKYYKVNILDFVRRGGKFKALDK